MTKMIGYGMPGVWTHAFVDMWSPGYLGFMSSNHNGMLRMYETMGNGGANTMRRTIGGGARWTRRRRTAARKRRPLPKADGRGGGRGGTRRRMTAREWYRPLPPTAHVVWSMRNNTNYMETGRALGAGTDRRLLQDGARELLR